MHVSTRHEARSAKRLTRRLASLAVVAALALTALPATQVRAAAQASDQPATITIINQIDGIDPALEPTMFAFLQQPRINDLGAGFTLTNGESNTFETPAGRTRITRGPMLDWAVTQVDCGATPVSVASTEATIEPAPGDQVTCTFTNKWTPPARVTISKAVTNGGDDTDFPFRFNGAGGTLKNGESRVFRAEVGSFSITEFVTGGWKQADTSCGDSLTLTSSRVSIRTTTSFPIAAGDEIICTSTSEPAGPSSLTLSIATVDAPAGDDTMFVFEGLNGVQGGDPGRFTIGESAPVSFTIDAGFIGLNQILTETPGWEMTDFTCIGAGNHRGADDDDVRERPRMSVEILPETDVNCTITNTRFATTESPAVSATQLSAPKISVAPSGPAPGPFDPISPIAAESAPAATGGTGVGGGSDEVLGTTLAATGARSHTTVAATLLLVGACFLSTARVTGRRAD